MDKYLDDTARHIGDEYYSRIDGCYDKIPNEEGVVRTKTTKRTWLSRMAHTDFDRPDIIDAGVVCGFVIGFVGLIFGVLVQSSSNIAGLAIIYAALGLGGCLVLGVPILSCLAGIASAIIRKWFI